MRALMGLLLLGVLVGCGSEEAGPQGGPGQPGTHQGQTGGGAGGSKVANILFPIAKDYHWTYTTKSQVGSICAEGDSEMKITGEATGPDGKAYYVIMAVTPAGTPNPCFPAGAFRVEGEKTLIQGAKWEIFVDDKLEVGHKWKSLFGDYKYSKKLDTVEVPAGRFKDCWVREEELTKTSLTFCKGVGLVQLKGPDFEGKLSKKNF